MNHRAIRHVLKDNDIIRMERMAETIADNRTRDLWKEVKMIKARNNVTYASFNIFRADFGKI